jgi:hypothetical protein
MQATLNHCDVMIQKLISSHIKNLESEAKAKGLSRRQWLLRAKVAQSTWYRWRQGVTIPNARTLKRLEQFAAR